MSLSDKKSILDERTKTISLQPFPNELRLIVTTDIPASEKKVRERHNDYCTKIVSNARTGAISLHSKDLSIMHIIMPYRCDVGYIAHEVWHIVRSMLLYSGASLDNEVVAYYIGWLTREIIKFNFDATKIREKENVDKNVFKRGGKAVPLRSGMACNRMHECCCQKSFRQQDVRRS